MTGKATPEMRSASTLSQRSGMWLSTAAARRHISIRMNTRYLRLSKYRQRWPHALMAMAAANVDKRAAHEDRSANSSTSAHAAGCFAGI